MSGCAVVFANWRDIGGRGDRLRRRREIARIAGVQRRAVERLVDDVDARAELVGVDILPHLVEAQAGIQRQLVGDAPLVLDVEAGNASQASNCRRSTVNGASIGLPTRSSGSTVEILLFCVLSPLDREARAQRMGVVELVGAVALQAIGEAAAVDVRSDAVEDEIADRVGDEMQRAVAGERGELEVEVRSRISAAPATPNVFCSAWCSLSSDESKLLMPKAVNAACWPGLFGIWKRFVVLPKIVLTRVCGSSTVEV